MALRADGTVWTWGDNSSGQLGDGTTNDHAVPALVDEFSLADNGWLDEDPDNDGLPNYRELQLGTDPLNPDTNGDGILDHAPENRTREKSGWYVWVDVQPWKRWLFGVRYDWTEFPNGRGREWTVGPYVSFMPSDFLRFRLGYKHTERDKRDLFGENGGSARIVDEILLQATFLLGAHPAHPF